MDFVNSSVSEVGSNRGIPDETLAYERFSLFSQCVIMPTLFLVGIPSNVVNCVVFWRQGLKDRMNLCLVCLSLADLLHLTFLFVQSVIGPFLELGDKVLGQLVYNSITAYTKWFSLQMNSMSGCISLVIAVERCVCVTFPLRATSLISTGTTGALLTAVYVITQLGFIVNIFNYDVIAMKDNASDQIIGWQLVPSKTWSANYVLFTAVQRFILLTVLPFGIFVGLSVTTALTVAKLKAAMLWREQTSCSTSDSFGQQGALTKMLVLVSCLHIVTAAPQLVFILVVHFVSDFNFGGRYENVFRVVVIIKGLCAMIDSSVSFLIYYSQSSRYRCTVLAMFCWMKQSAKGHQKCKNTFAF